MPVLPALPASSVPVLWLVWGLFFLILLRLPLNFSSLPKFLVQSTCTPRFGRCPNVHAALSPISLSHSSF